MDYMSIRFIPWVPRTAVLLIMLIDELSKNMHARKQTDLILLDFSKAFHKATHEKLLKKFILLALGGHSQKWITDFLDNRKQSVTNDNNSSTISVSYGVPQGSVLGPIPFLAYINDLPEQVRPRVRLFADDTAMYFCISSLSEANILQEDLRKLENGKWIGT